MNLPLQLDRTAAVPLQDQLFEQLRRMILCGALKPNSRIIATRFLAEQLGISRTTVLLAYERLIAEGYLETRPAIGTFVAAALPVERRHDAAHKDGPEIARHALLYPGLIDDFPAADDVEDDAIDFDPSQLDGSNLLPAKTWTKTIRRIIDREPDGLAQRQPEGGVMALRSAIADHLASTRGIMASPEQVIIVSGRRQAASFVTHLFQRPGDRVVLEKPCDRRVETFYRARRSEIAWVPVDEHGLRVDLLPAGRTAIGYITPARQDPVGGTLPHARRESLIEWARTSGAYLIEDDCDSEFRYSGAAPPPLAAIDPYGLVFHTGSFAKALGAGLGIGYVIVPSEFVGKFLAIKHMAEAATPWLEQMAVAELLVTGELDHHLRRVRKLYLARRDSLIEALKSHFGTLRLIGTETGTQLTWLLPGQSVSPDSIQAAAAAQRVRFGVLGADGQEESLLVNGGLVFGYAGLPENALRDGIDRLVKVLPGS